MVYYQDERLERITPSDDAYRAAIRAHVRYKHHGDKHGYANSKQCSFHLVDDIITGSFVIRRSRNDSGAIL